MFSYIYIKIENNNFENLDISAFFEFKLYRNRIRRKQLKMKIQNRITFILLLFYNYILRLYR